jgi:glycosyltransferase involved in cell wall biosynthesis
MKVVIVCPTVRSSAIGAVTLSIWLCLPPEWDVQLWSPALGARLASDCAVREFDEVSPSMLDELRQFDMVVYLLGDSPWHREILRMATIVPGLVVLHDVSLANLVIDLFDHDRRFHDLLDYIELSYGPSARDRFEHLNPSEDPDSYFQLMDDVPLVELAVERSLGILVHSHWAAERVAGLTLGDITVAALPVPDRDVHPGTGDSPELSGLVEGLDDNAVLLVTLGVVNHNRRIERVLEALAGDDTLSRCHVVVAGAISESARASLEKTALTHGLGDRLRILGTVSDSDLDVLLARADGCLVLRDPVLEAASASLLVQMRRGVPVVVYDHGHYSELPRGSVIKVDPAQGIAALRDALRSVADGTAAVVGTGTIGADHVVASHTPRAYAVALALAINRAVGTRPTLETSRRLGAQLGRLDLHDRSIIASSVIDAQLELFGV